MPTRTRLAVSEAEPETVGFLPLRATGAQDGAPILLPDEAHAMTFAPTGAGKAVSCAIPALLQYPGPMVVLDIRGELAAVTARRRREMGQEVAVVDPFGISGELQATLNPFDLVEPDTIDAADDLRSLVAAMMPPDFASRDVFWRNRGVHLASAAGQSIVEGCPASDRTLLTLRDDLHALARRIQRGGGSPLDGAPPPSRRSRGGRRTPEGRLDDLMAMGSAETVGGMLHYALEAVGFVEGAAMERSLAATSFDLEAITEGRPLTIYLVLPPHLLASHAPLLRIWFHVVFALLMRRRARPPLATLVLLDEAAQLGPFDALRTALTLLRGYGVATWSFWQDPSQLRSLYPRDWQTLLNNCRVLQAFGQTGDRARAEVAEVLGIDAGRLLGLTRERMAIGVDGAVRLARRLDYRTDPGFAGQFDLNPTYAGASGPYGRPRLLPDAPAPARNPSHRMPGLLTRRLGPPPPTGAYAEVVLALDSLRTGGS